MSIIPINAPERAPPNIPFVELDDAPVAPDSVSVADSHNSYNPDPENLLQSKQLNLVVYRELTQLPVLLDLSKSQFVPTDSSIRNSRTNNAIIFGMRLVTLF